MTAPPLTVAPSRLGPYWPLILEQAPRTLSLMDRDEYSPTAGCCDRTFWAWKFTDFPGPRFQEAVCVLAYLHSRAEEGSTYARSPQLARWLDLGMRYWCGRQHRDGSFDEAYPFERSLAATSFTAFYVSEALGFASAAISPATREAVQASLARAGDWLCRNDEGHGFLSNHLAAAAAALEHIGRITGEDRFVRRSRFFLERILARQSAEGWYDEYGGADPGYQTHGTFYLARIWQLTEDPALLASLDRSARFLAHFVHPDGSLGGEYASRNTQTYYPAAYEMLAAHSSAARWIAETLRSSIGGARAAGLRGVDAYNYFPFLNNLVFAARAFVGGEPPARAEDPTPERGLSWFPRAGILRLRRPRYDAWVGTAKGGVLKVFDRDRRELVYSDCGYIGTLKGGGHCSTQYLDHERIVRVAEQEVDIAGGMAAFSRPVLSPVRFVAFRLFTLSLGRLAGMARWLKRYLVRVLIYRRRNLDIQFHRRIRFRDESVTVEDTLGGPGAGRLSGCAWSPLFTTIHMGSSRYFIESELCAVPPPGAETIIAPARLLKPLRLTREVRLASTGGAR